ncbi:hypothetical protein QUF58_02555 [Anaerolineales bacterium HSG24]|nr:hypothetical protein [Anaerolineales bacterium HSG24]
MQTLELPIDITLLQKARQAAIARQATLETLMVELIERLAQQTDPIIGLFADEADLIDTILEDVMQTRQNAVLRTSHA